MGGYGSGKRRRLDAKRTTGSMLSIDIRDIYRRTHLQPGLNGDFSWSGMDAGPGAVNFWIEETCLLLAYERHQSDGSNTEVAEFVSIDRTECHYGGARAWFQCPRCVRRVAKLFFGDKGFCCRQCNDLTYACQQESPQYRLMRKAQKVRECLGGSSSVLEPFPLKPKGMHWKTYLHWYTKAADTERRAWGCVALRLPGRKTEQKVQA